MISGLLHNVCRLPAITPAMCVPAVSVVVNGSSAKRTLIAKQRSANTKNDKTINIKAYRYNNTLHLHASQYPLHITDNLLYITILN